jgi:hypothetical protein
MIQKFHNYLYKHETTLKHNELAFLWNTIGGCTSNLVQKMDITIDVFELFQLQNDANFMVRLHSKIQVKKTMVVELCTSNFMHHVMV